MATVSVLKRKRKNGVKYAVLYKDPITLQSKYYKTYARAKDANQAAHKLRELIDNGRTPEIERTKPKLSLRTFGEVADLLVDEWRQRNERGDLAQKTYDEYLIGINVLKREFGDELMTEITLHDILDYQQERASKFSNVAANRSLFLIKQVFIHGMMVRAVTADPAADVNYLSEKAHERNKFLMPAELHKLVESSRQTRAMYYLPALIYLGAEHGASKQECLGLRWSDIDFGYQDCGIIRFYRTKNSKERTEFLMPRTKAALLEWKQHLEYMRHRKNLVPVQEEYVFCRLDGTPIKRFDKAFQETCKIAGLTDFHFHDLRHTYCSNLLLSGSTLKDVNEMIGHSDLSMTNRYSHLTMEHKKARQEKLAEHYGE